MNQETIQKNLERFLEDTGATEDDLLTAIHEITGTASPDADTWTVVFVRKQQSTERALHGSDVVDAPDSTGAFRAALTTRIEGADSSWTLDELRSQAPIEIVGLYPGAHDNYLSKVSPAYAGG